MRKFETIFRRKKPQQSTGNPVLPSSHPCLGTRLVQSSSKPGPLASSFPDGIKVLHDCPEATVDVCFVHGLSGNRDKTWTVHGEATSWPKALLPPALPRARIITFGYDAYMVRSPVVSSNRLIDHATNLLADLTSDRAIHKATHRPLIFIAHSVGGIVCKEAVLLSRNNPEVHLRSVFKFLEGIVFMGTPHRGSWMADWAKIPASALGLVRSTNKSLLDILDTNDQFLESIQLMFLAMLRELRESGRNLQVTCFVEELPLTGIGIVVPKESATFEGYNSITIHANHKDLVKFKSADDQGFKRLLGELIRWESQISMRTSTKVSDTDSESNVDNRKAATPRYTFHNSGTGWISVNTGSAPQNINNGSGLQFNGPIQGLQLSPPPN
ncbi:Alpha/Beta hydrolase protein [Ilyonectria sp. MPI-CAGE-AT-0026]|nr:Alpha/Beta hydrolase protein [Ilyonectria sp. MPI-CAGE-AT-0026]